METLVVYKVSIVFMSGLCQASSEGLFLFGFQRLSMFETLLKQTLDFFKG